MIFSDTRLMNHFMHFENVFFFSCYYVWRFNFLCFGHVGRTQNNDVWAGKKGFNKFHLNLWKIQRKLKENTVKSNLLTRIRRLANSIYLLDVITFLKEPVHQYPAHSNGLCWLQLCQGMTAKTQPPQIYEQNKQINSKIST